ncbi:hypothetical protein Tco_0787152, partial [Tanacetum coccineum]
MSSLVEVCLMPLAIKTQNDNFKFVHELKQEMFTDLEYVKSLEKEIDELEFDNAIFSNTYDLLLQECVSKDIMCSYFHSLSDLDAHSELQCLYLHKVKECECIAQKLSKQTEFVSKEVYTELLRSFAKLEKHSISFELALQQCQEQMKNDTVCKEKASNLKKLTEKCKGKYVETKFDKTSVVRQPNAQRITKPSVLGKPAHFSDSLERKSFSQTKSVPKTNVSESLSKTVTPYSWPQDRKLYFAKPYDVNAPGPSRNSPKHVSFQSPRESVGSNDIVRNYYLEEAKKKAQLQKDKALNTKPSVQQSARLPNTANEPPKNQKSFLKSKDLACPTCKKCIYSANHDKCNLKYLSKVNSRASAQKNLAQSHKTTKRYIPVEKKSDSKNHGRQIPIGQRFSPNKSSNVYLKTMPPRSGLTWKPTGRIFTQVRLKWILIRKSVETCYNTNDSASPLGKETHNPKTVICANSSSLSAGTSMASEPISSKGSSNAVFILINGEPWLYGGGGIPFQLKSNSLPHAHAQTTKTYYKHQESRIKKAQDSKTKTSANSDIQDLPSRYQVYQGRLLASFQDDAYESDIGLSTGKYGGDVVRRCGEESTPSLKLDQESSYKKQAAEVYFFLGGLILLLVLLIVIISLRKFIRLARLGKSVKREDSCKAAKEYFSGKLQTLSYFSFRTLKEASKNFHECNLLGKGGFGPVYM